MVENFQRTSQRIKYAQVPVVSVVRGLAPGGGCEFQMHSARTVAHLESYIGLVEAGVGLLPAGGGLKELATRASQQATGGDVFNELKKVFETIAMAKVSTSALHAKELGLLRADDKIVFHAHELLHIAKAEARVLAEAGYRPRCRRTGQVAGDGQSPLKMPLVNMLEGRFISPYDNEIAERIATILCGGKLDRGAPMMRNGYCNWNAGILSNWRNRKNPSAYRPHVEDRQAVAKLIHASLTRRFAPPSPHREGTSLRFRSCFMSTHIQDAYIVAATRTPVGKAPKGGRFAIPAPTTCWRMCCAA